MGEDTDHLVLGLAAAGLAVTAATYVSVGGAAPVRAGLTLVKDARKVGRLGEGLTQWAGRSAREIVDAPMLQQAVATGSVMRPGETVGAIKAAFRAEKAGALVRLAKDVGRVGEKAGIARRARYAADRRRPEGRRARRAARRSEGRPDPRDPEIAGPRRAAAGRRRFNLTLWVFGALLALFGLLSSIKATTERLTGRGCTARRRGGCASRRRPPHCCPARLWRRRGIRLNLRPLPFRIFPQTGIDDAELS